MSAPTTPPAERRHNRSLRDQAQAWFDALRLQIAKIESAEPIAAQMKEWKRPEDVMHAYPALVPLFLDIAWHSRKTDGFAGLFETESGGVAEEATELLAWSGKTFDDIVIAHLMGTMRLTCERRQNEWVAAERVRRRRGLAKMPLVGNALRELGLITPVKKETLLLDYPQKGLYETLKPFLKRREQFALVDALSSLPTRTATLLGPVAGLLNSAAVIRTLADLDRAAVKIAIEMVEAFVQAIEGSQAKANETEFAAAPRCAALSDLLSVGTRFLKLATANRDLAKDAIAKLAPAMQAEFWTVCNDADALRRVAECPAAIAERLKALTVEVSERVSIALADITDGRVAAHAVDVMREGTDPETFLAWLRDETYVSTWKQLVVHLNRIPSVPLAGEKLGPNVRKEIKIVCERGARVFGELTEEPLKKAA